MVSAAEISAEDIRNNVTHGLQRQVLEKGLCRQQGVGTSPVLPPDSLRGRGAGK